MNWFMKRRSLKPSLTNLIKPLLKCRDTKQNIVKSENFMQLCMSLTSVILLFSKTTQYYFQMQLFQPMLLQNSFQILLKSANITNRQKYNWSFTHFLTKKISKKSSFSSLSCSWCKDSTLSCTSLCFALKSMFPQKPCLLNLFILII